MVAPRVGAGGFGDVAGTFVLAFVAGDVRPCPPATIAVGDNGLGLGRGHSIVIVDLVRTTPCGPVPGGMRVAAVPGP